MKRQRKFYFGNDIITAAALLITGLMFIIYKGEIISLAMSIIGAVLIALGIIDIVRGWNRSGIVKLVLGITVLVAGWAFISVALYILGAFLLVAGISELVLAIKIRGKRITLGYITHIMQPIVYILAGLCLFLNQGASISWVFTVSGIFLVVDGAIGLIGAFGNK